MTAGNVRAGRAYVEIAADSTRLGRDLRSAQTQLRGFGDSVRNIGLQLGAVFSGAALSTGILNSAKSFADAGSALDDLSQRSGASVESLGALSLAAKPRVRSAMSLPAAYCLLPVRRCWKRSSLWSASTTTSGGF